MNDTTYNGWSNFETWKINLEWFDGMEFDNEVTAEFCQDLVEEVLFDNCDYQPALSLATSFLASVNWYEIAEHINEMIKEA